MRLKNNSGEPVTAVKFAWFLFLEKDSKNILKQGKTPVLTVPRLLDGASKVIDYPIVSFADIYKQFVKDGKLAGDFVIEVAVTEITYEDGSVWERK